MVLSCNIHGVIQCRIGQLVDNEGIRTHRFTGGLFSGDSWQESENTDEIDQRNLVTVCFHKTRQGVHLY
jgi:hypothetical protein